MLPGTDGTINGWRVILQPDFVKFFTTNRYLDRLNTGGPKKAKQLIEMKIRAICNSASPGSSTYPKLGNMKWLRGKKGVKIQEDRLTGDYRILFLPTKPDEQELTFFAIRDHDGVQEFLRDAHARVHNAAMDEFSILEWEEGEDYSVDMSQDNAEEQVQKIQAELENIVGKEEVVQNEQQFIDVARTCSIYRLGKYGIELDPSSEQIEHINSPSPMLLPGVAGTGKSTVLQYRFRDAILSYGDHTDEFFKHGIYLTLNKPLSKSTRREVKKILPAELGQKVDIAIQDINSWVSALLGEEEAISTPNLTFEFFRKWWSRRQTLQKYDPAQAWEEYRGVIKGTAKSLDYDDGTITVDDYIAMPHDRCAYPDNQRTDFYNDIVAAFDYYRKQSDNVLYDDQDLIRKVKQMNLPQMYRHIFIDEVQDLTELQLLVAMEMLEAPPTCICSSGKKSCNCPPSCENCQCLIFDVTGDLSQQVYPTRFRWEDTKRAIYESLKLRCHERKPMATSYRSVRSIVDLSSYYLDNMVDDYRQGGDIAQAQAEQKAETPALIEATSERLHDIISDAELPASHCPIIVRDEATKLNLEDDLIRCARNRIAEKIKLQFPGSSEVQEEELLKAVKLAETRITSYTLTVADAKGLEWNNVVLWDLSSGSDYLLERKLHERRGAYIEEEDWNYQLELRHAFVATTRARLLLLHLGKIRKEHNSNPFYEDLLDKELIVIESEPVDLTRFSKSELTAEEYEVMAEDYENKEMYGAAAYIYENNLNNPKKATEMQYLDAKKSNDSLLMAKIMIQYERTHDDATLGPKEQQHVLNLLNENGQDTELGYIIEIANMLGLENKAKLAELKRKVNLANIFGDAETYLSIAKDYEDLEEWSKSGDFYAKANAKKEAVEAWWKGNSYEKAWEVIVQTLAPSPNLSLELLLIDLMTKQRMEKTDGVLFKQQFGVDYDEGWNVLKDMNIKLADFEFTCSESKERVAELALASLSSEERAKRYHSSGNWRQALGVYLEDGELDFRAGLNACRDIGTDELHSWFRRESEEKNPGLTSSRKLQFYQFLFAQRFENKPNLNAMRDFVLELNLPEMKRQNIGAGSALQRWHHSLYCIANPQDGNTGPGRANIGVIIRWYTEDDTLENDLLLHSMRCALYASLEATYIAFEKITQRRLENKNYVKEALIVTELYMKTMMNPRRYSPGNYPRVRNALIGWMKDTEIHDFVDAWFDFFLDMKPDQALLNKNTVLKRDIQTVFPLFRDQVEGYVDGLPSVGLYPDDSLTRRYEGGTKKYSFSPAGLKILRSAFYSKGLFNAVNRIVDEFKEEGHELNDIYVQQMVINLNTKIEPKCFFETIEQFLSNQQTVVQETARDGLMTNVVEANEILEDEDREEMNTVEEVEYEGSTDETIQHPNQEDDAQNQDSPVEPMANQASHAVTAMEAEEEQDVEAGEPVNEDQLNPNALINDLHENTPEDVSTWFIENHSKTFVPDNSRFIIECYTTFIKRLERQPTEFTANTVNEWLCFHEILKIMREAFKFSENPYVGNQSMAEQLAQARRFVAENRGEYSKQKVAALINIR